MSKLLFIYNANSGKLNGYLDALHKVISPKTYACNLCDITYGIFTENKVWKKFRTSSKIPMEFLHLDEFKTQYASKFLSKYTFPSVLFVNNGELEILITTEELNRMKSPEELIHLIVERIEVL
ncbi:MAG: GTPase [Flavobacteriales bacterium]|jgi:hypothetical protein|nr:GTPase [Flavobacteriales bacterium]